MGEGYVSILINNHAGSTTEDPMAYVELPTPAIVQPPTSEHLPNPVVPTPYSTFSKRMRATTSLCQSDFKITETYFSSLAF